MNVQNKTVLITSASRGIGRALVSEALRRGATKVYAGTRFALPRTDTRVAPLRLDATSASPVQRAVDEIDTLDVLINNGGVALYDDLSDLDAIEHLAVNALGALRVTHAFLPLLTRAQGAIVNSTPSAALAAHMTRSLRVLLAGQGVTIHTVVLEMPAAAAAQSAAQRIFDGLENGEDDIFHRFADFMQKPAA
jgi:NAD(P)-dependent dehydrogenase (short-subunit alcohol dehydrogenase family)